mmetsp:Transcript_12042/g.23384  ORF Transcript_12042/g.23384 Transcript_12042/m.23384 type:complete len:218 (-) Transcript_12042:550-1203(-)
MYRSARRCCCCARRPQLRRAKHRLTRASRSHQPSRRRCERRSAGRSRALAHSRGRASRRALRQTRQLGRMHTLRHTPPHTLPHALPHTHPHALPHVHPRPRRAARLRAHNSTELRTGAHATHKSGWCRQPRVEDTHLRARALRSCGFLHQAGQMPPDRLPHPPTHPPTLLGTSQPRRCPPISIRSQLDLLLISACKSPRGSRARQTCMQMASLASSR